MIQSEFDLIRTLQACQQVKRADCVVGIGDDCAIVIPPADQQLVMTMDTLVEGIHFDRDIGPADLAHKLLAVNFSDLAAMGATPLWGLLSLTLPTLDEAWLSAFSHYFFNYAAHQQLQIIGGDTTRGPRSVSLQMTGAVMPTKYLTRAGAQVGDHIFVSGTLGDAAAGLHLREQQQQRGNNAHTDFLIDRLYRPTPRLTLGQALVNIASSAIDISDGLLADLNHILQASQVGAVLQSPQLPLSPALIAKYPRAQALEFACSGGDDYELCFTVPPARLADLASLQTTLACPVTAIGTIIPNAAGLKILDAQGELLTVMSYGYDHFR